MSLQSNRVLRDLLKCQRFEGNAIFVDYEKETLSGCCESHESDVVVRFRYPSPVMLSIFKQLSDDGFIVDCSDDQWRYLKVTHSGNHFSQSRAVKLLSFLSSSVLVPIIVTILTSAAFHLLAYWFPGFKSA